MIALLAIGFFALAVGVTVYTLLRPADSRYLYARLREDKHMPTELPGAVDRTVGNLTSWRFTRRLAGYEDSAAERAIEQSGNPWGITLQQYYALTLAATLAGGLVTAVVFTVLAGLLGLAGGSLGMVPVAGGLGFLIGAFLGSRYPLSKMRSIVNRRHREVMLNLHEALDLFSMGTATGASVPMAMMMTRDYLLEGALRDEVSRVCDDISAGVPFNEAIDGLYARVPTKRVLTFTRHLKDANTDGKDRTDRLRREAAEIREDQQRLMEQRSNKVQMVFVGAILFGLLPLMLIPFAIPLGLPLLGMLGGQ